MNDHTKQELITRLSTGIINLEFTKTNGEKRTMKCTLQESYLPPAPPVDQEGHKRVRTVSPELLCVWDIDKQGWRSMRVANILTVTEDQ